MKSRDEQRRDFSALFLASIAVSPTRTECSMESDVLYAIQLAEQVLMTLEHREFEERAKGPR